MSKEYKQKPLEQIHEELFEAGLTPNEIKQHIMDVTWFRYLDTLTPFEAIFRQTAAPEASSSHSQHHDDYGWMEEELTPEELEHVEEAIAEQEKKNKEFEQMKVDMKEVKDKLNDYLIDKHLYDVVVKHNIKEDKDGNNDSKDKDKKEKGD